MQSLWQDLRYGSRLMWRNAGFSVAAIATLALGIGANSAIFSLLNVVLLKPLPYREPARVAFVLGWDTEEGEMRFNMRLADYRDLQQNARSLESVAAYSYLSANLTGGAQPERVQAYRVTPNTFTLLGVAAAHGRTLDARDEREAADVAVISHGLWQRRFGSDAAIVGRRVILNGRSHEIVGVMPSRFEFPVFNFKGDLWVPWPTRDARRGEPAGRQSATVIGRLRDGVSYAEAQSELDVFMRTLAAAHPDTNRTLGARLTEMGRLDDEQAGPGMVIVLITVALVLLLACANVANLLLARGVSRNRELAVRAAMGASRARIGRQLLIEAMLLALAGGLVGVLLAMVALRALHAALPEMLLTTVPNVDDLGVDGLTLGYTLLVTLVTSMVFGLLPAWRAARGDLQDNLKESASLGGSPGTRRWRTSLVVVEVALATLLLVAAGLMVRSYGALQRIDPGFRSDSVMTMALSLPEYRYPEADQRRRFYGVALERVRQVPGVVTAGFVNVLPFSTYDNGTNIAIEGAPTPSPGSEPSVAYRVASAGYFETMSIPLLEGRFLEGGDRNEGMLVAVVNRRLARRHFGEQSPLGRRVRLGRGESAPWRTIVGVVGDVHHSQLSADPDPEIYVPMDQADEAMMMLAARVRARPEDLVAPIRAELNAIDPDQPVYHVKALDRLVGDSLLPQSSAAVLMGLFAALALTLGAIGVYGVVAYGVSQQTREFGVRIALGATPRDLLRRVLGSGLRMVSVGVVLGMAAALAVSRLIAGALYGVDVLDPTTYLAVGAILTVTGVVACLVPAIRASSIRPSEALKN